MRFQQRDGEIINSIHYMGDGLLAQRQVKELFFPHASLRAMQNRIAKLCRHHYIERASNRDWRTKPIPEQIYWLGWKAALWIAGQEEIEVEYPRKNGENQMRKLQRTLREQGVRWLREPRWSKLQHDLAVIDFRLIMEKSVEEIPSINIEQWMRESEFRSDLDKVEFKVKGKNGKVTEGRRGVCPDYFVVITDKERKSRGEFYRLPLLLEIDMGTHPVSSRFRYQKAAPYAAYIKSQAYKKRFGLNTGVWLIVTNGKLRMKNLMKQTEETLGRDSKYFLFSRLSYLNTNILTEPIWYQAGDSSPKSILSL
jgi:hypothetical protein